jgi:deoxyribose-phosphate aldolase
MDLNSHLAEYLEEEKQTTFSKTELIEVVSLMDLTTLNTGDTEETIVNLCHKANSELGQVAAVCVYPNFIPIVSKELRQEAIKIASVANFPTGCEELESSLANIALAMSTGANEIDLVFPYTRYLQGKQEEAFSYIQKCKQACNTALLKVILEISEFSNLEEIYSLSLKVIASGADFIKTSTGKSKYGATIEAASVMLLAIKSCNNPHIGFKASGGIKTVEQAFAYIKLAKKIMGDQWVRPENFRIGASSLLDHALEIAY